MGEAIETREKRTADDRGRRGSSFHAAKALHAAIKKKEEKKRAKSVYVPSNTLSALFAHARRAENKAFSLRREKGLGANGLSDHEKVDIRKPFFFSAARPLHLYWSHPGCSFIILFFTAVRISLVELKQACTKARKSRRAVNLAKAMPAN